MPTAKGRPKTGGRKKGTPNKASADARAAIAILVDGNVHRFQEWLDRIANGTPANKKLGVKAIPPDPGKAYSLLLAMIEYHVPKQARIESTGKDGKELLIPPVFNIIGVSPRHGD